MGNALATLHVYITNQMIPEWIRMYGRTNAIPSGRNFNDPLSNFKESMLKLDAESAAAAKLRREDRSKQEKSDENGILDNEDDELDEDIAVGREDGGVSILSDITGDGNQDQKLKASPAKRKRANDTMGWLAFLVFGPLSAQPFQLWRVVANTFGSNGPTTSSVACVGEHARSTPAKRLKGRREKRRAKRARLRKQDQNYCDDGDSSTDSGSDEDQFLRAMQDLVEQEKVYSQALMLASMAMMQASGQTDEHVFRELTVVYQRRFVPGSTEHGDSDSEESLAKLRLQ